MAHLASLRQIGVVATRVATVAVFLFAVGTANSAEASCGDWLSGHAASQAADDLAPLAPKTPCNGPECRRSQDGLPFAPSSPNRQFDGPERWCRLLDELAPRPTLSSPLPPQAEVRTADGDRPSIDRPPRV